jgi:hypothetical protein
MKAMTLERKRRTHGARTAVEADAAECALASPEWEEVHTEDGVAAEAETKAIKTASGCRNS